MSSDAIKIMYKLIAFKLLTMNFQRIYYYIAGRHVRGRCGNDVHFKLGIVI
jgi:hypothetical protein